VSLICYAPEPRGRKRGKKGGAAMISGLHLPSYHSCQGGGKGGKEEEGTQCHDSLKSLLHSFPQFERKREGKGEKGTLQTYSFSNLANRRGEKGRKGRGIKK